MSQKVLTLKEKVDVIKYYKSEKCGVHKLAEQFYIEKTQAAETVKNKDKIIEMWFDNRNEKQCGKTSLNGAGIFVDSVVFESFCIVRAHNVPGSSPLIQNKALEVAKEVGASDFKASNGWLEKFRVRHKISYKTVCAESAAVNVDTVDGWIKKLPSETCSGTKSSKERLTVLLCAYVHGEKEKPLVIDKAAKPRFFKGLGVKNFPVHCKHNKKSWLTREIMEWLMDLDRKMKRQKRKILLLFDNATSHHEIKLDFVKAVLFPITEEESTETQTTADDDGLLANLLQTAGGAAVSADDYVNVDTD
ncbi:tigger transposable element-derived protein 4-like [Belonocnema kinseyi]|uniref:tigger transposable element-derived protein 4-like n=1 Tax=Belonocnema kinseyi TaxID=2817044 RepID=UPI00143D2228|nr:tigger transposable element-derived protein 4-like [Belonocnema kinseyi]